MSKFIDRIRRAYAQSSINEFVWPNTNVEYGQLLSDAQRCSKYHRFSKIYMGQFKGLRPADDLFFGGTLPSNANLMARAADTLHAAIAREAPVANSSQARLQQFAREWLSDDRVWDEISQNIHTTIILGDATLRVELDGGEVLPVAGHPAAYFPTLNPSRPDRALDHGIAYPSLSGGDEMMHHRWEKDLETGTWHMLTGTFDRRSGAEGGPPAGSGYEADEDLGIKISPFVHTYCRRLAGTYWGKAAMDDAEGMVLEFASLIAKIGVIASNHSTNIKEVAPAEAFDERGDLIWELEAPLKIDREMAPHWKKAEYGFMEAPGGGIIEPLTAFLDDLKEEVFASFGLTPGVYGETGGMRDVSEPGIARANLTTEYTVRMWQSAYSRFLTQLVLSAYEMTRVTVDSSLPELENKTTIDWQWQDFAPESERESADLAEIELRLGLPKRVVWERRLGIANAQELIDEAAKESAGQFIDPKRGDDTDLADDEIDLDQLA